VIEIKAGITTHSMIPVPNGYERVKRIFFVLIY